MIDRKAIAGLALSASALVALVVQEGYTDRAIIPVKGDVPTLGNGSTTHLDGTPVKLGDTTTPVKALVRTLAYVQDQDIKIKRCVTAPLHQGEYDLMHDFGYQYGINAVCRSSMVAKANAGDYAGSCVAYKDYRMVRAAPGEKPGPGFVMGKDGVLRYDCSTLVNGKPNKRCWGVWTRQLERHTACMALQ